MITALSQEPANRRRRDRNECVPRCRVVESVEIERGHPVSTADANERVSPSPRWWDRRRGALVSMLKWAVALAAAGYFLRLMRRVDWGEVGEALGRLDGWHIAVLLVVVLLRQVLAALPLALFVPGLSLRRAMANDHAGMLVAAVAPAPSDIVLRLAMFQSWRVDTVAGVTGLTLNSVLYYIARFSAPALGLVLVLAGGLDYDPAFGWPALTSGLVAIGVVTGLVLALRARRSAAAIGRIVGRTLGRLRRDDSLVGTWEGRLVDFQRAASGLLRAKAVPAAAATIGLLLVEATLVLLSLRFVGVTADQAGSILIIAAFLCVYPLTALPLLGLGVLDASFVAILADRTVVEPEDLIAGLVIFRVGIQLVPMTVGAGVLLHWRRRRTASGITSANTTTR
jgi:hypothetical protein